MENNQKYAYMLKWLTDTVYQVLLMDNSFLDDWS